MHELALRKFGDEFTRLGALYGNVTMDTTSGSTSAEEQHQSEDRDRLLRLDAALTLALGDEVLGLYTTEALVHNFNDFFIASNLAAREPGQSPDLNDYYARDDPLLINATAEAEATWRFSNVFQMTVEN